MDYAVKFIALAREGLPLMDFALHFCQLTVKTAFDDETLKSLLSLLGRGVLSCRPPRHHRTWLEGGHHPVSGELPSPNPDYSQTQSPAHDHP